MSETRIAVVLGTRPEIIKLSPVIRAAQRRDIPFTLIHTGQHYSKDLDEVFFEDLNLPRPDHNLGVGSASQVKQTGEMLVRIEEVLTADEPDVVLVQGDTNSVLAGAVAAAKLTPKIGHVEAGLRSYDRAMPEETNRVLTDHASDYLFAPTADAADNLSKEGIDGERVFVTGNTVVDAVQQNQTLAAEHSSVLSRLNVEEGGFVLMTAHRAENVDNDDRFIDIFSSAEQVAAEFELPVIYPIHPRAKQRIDEFDISVPDAVRLVDPLDFLDFLRLEDAARLVLTDSGGVQEETCILGTPCVTMRDSTERPETVEVGANTVVGTAPADVLEGAKLMVTRTDDWSNPFGDGSAADRILDIVIDED